MAQCRSVEQTFQIIIRIAVTKDKTYYDCKSSISVFNALFSEEWLNNHGGMITIVWIVHSAILTIGSRLNYETE